MHSPRRLLATTLFALALSLCLSTHGGSPVAFAQTPQTDEREGAVKLYEAGDAAGAVQALQAFVKKQKKDVRAWHYLGLALNGRGQTKDALKAHEKAAKLAVELVNKKLEELTEVEDLTGRLSAYKEHLLEGADSADKYVQLSSKLSNSKIVEWQERAQLLRDFAWLGEEKQNKNLYSAKEVKTRARVIFKPNPDYTEEARRNQDTGTVTLFMIFSSDGKIRGLIPIHSLPHGLTESAMKAARAIRFTPATIDGKPVSQFIRIEYNFNIY